MRWVGVARPDQALILFTIFTVAPQLKGTLLYLHAGPARIGKWGVDEALSRHFNSDIVHLKDVHLLRAAVDVLYL